MVKKISVSLPDELEAAARRSAEAEGLAVSTWLARAVRRELADVAIRSAGRAAILDEIASSGPFDLTSEEQRWVDGVLASARLAGEAGHQAAG